MINVTLKEIISFPMRTSFTNFVSSIPTMNIIAPTMAAGNTEKRPAIDADRKSPREISMTPSMMFVPPVRAPK